MYTFATLYTNLLDIGRFSYAEPGQGANMKRMLTSLSRVVQDPMLQPQLVTLRITTAMAMEIDEFIESIGELSPRKSDAIRYLLRLGIRAEKEKRGAR